MKRIVLVNHRCGDSGDVVDDPITVFLRINYGIVIIFCAFDRHQRLIHISYLESGTDRDPIISDGRDGLLSLVVDDCIIGACVLFTNSLCELDSCGKNARRRHTFCGTRVYTNLD